MRTIVLFARRNLPFLDIICFALGLTILLMIMALKSDKIDISPVVYVIDAFLWVIGLFLMFYVGKRQQRHSKRMINRRYGISAR